MNPVALMAVIKINLLRRPLWHPILVQECLEVSRVKLRAMIDNGELPWAWNFGRGTAKKEIRILAHSVVEKTIGPLAAIGATRNLKLPEVINLLLPQTRASMRATELQRLFCVSHDLIIDLHRQREIQIVRENLPAVGFNASPRFTRASLAAMLEKRRII